MNTVLDKYVERQVFCPGVLMFQCGQTEGGGRISMWERVGSRGREGAEGGDGRLKSLGKWGWEWGGDRGLSKKSFKSKHEV